MPFINFPPFISGLFDDLDKRIRRLETAVRFTAPVVSTEPIKPIAADIIYQSTKGYLEYWNGTSWIAVADNGAGTPVVSFTSSWTGTGLTYTGFPAQGVYQKIGKQIHFQIKVTCTNVTNFGTGQYSLSLPFAPNYDYVAQGGYHDVSANNHYVIIGDMNIGTTALNLYVPTSNGAITAMKYNTPKTIATTDYFYVHGNYLTA